MLGTIVINKQKSNCYGNIRFFQTQMWLYPKGTPDFDTRFCPKLLVADF